MKERITYAGGATGSRARTRITAERPAKLVGELQPGDFFLAPGGVLVEVESVARHGATVHVKAYAFEGVYDSRTAVRLKWTADTWRRALSLARRLVGANVSSQSS